MKSTVGNETAKTRTSNNRYRAVEMALCLFISSVLFLSSQMVQLLFQRHHIHKWNVPGCDVLYSQKILFLPEKSLNYLFEMVVSNNMQNMRFHFVFIFIEWKLRCRLINTIWFCLLYHWMLSSSYAGRISLNGIRLC